MILIVCRCFLSWRIGVKCEQKEAVSRPREDSTSGGSSWTPKCIFKKSARWIFGLCWLFWSQRRVLSSCIHSTQLSNCIELILWAIRSLEDLELKCCLEIHNCIATHNRYHISLIWQVHSQRSRLLIDLISGGAKIPAQSLNARQSKVVTVSLFFHPLCPPPPLPMGLLFSPQFRSHQETSMVAHRTQQQTPMISQKNRGLWTVCCVDKHNHNDF